MSDGATTHKSQRPAGVVCWNIGGRCYYSFTFIGVPMKTQEYLYLEYARCITMTREYNATHGTDIKPWECVKNITNLRFDKNPGFAHMSPGYYTFAISILEGKPVFVGDKLFHKSTGIPWTVTDPENDLSHMIWTPPKKKRTFEINGVELPCPVKDDKEMTEHRWGFHQVFYFESESDVDKWRSYFNNLLIEARDKE